ARLWRRRPRVDRAPRLEPRGLSPTPAGARRAAAPGRAAAMTRKRRRLVAVLAGMSMLGIAAVLVLNAFSDSLVFFYSPSDLKAKAVPQGRMLRIGGLVEEASVKRGGDGKTVTFRITDGSAAVPVTYSGALPDLFREGQGVVVEGRLDRAGAG